MPTQLPTNPIVELSLVPSDAAANESILREVGIESGMETQDRNILGIVLGQVKNSKSIEGLYESLNKSVVSYTPKKVDNTRVSDGFYNSLYDIYELVGLLKVLTNKESRKYRGASENKQLLDIYKSMSSGQSLSVSIGANPTSFDISAIDNRFSLNKTIDPNPVSSVLKKLIETAAPGIENGNPFGSLMSVEGLA